MPVFLTFFNIRDLYSSCVTHTQSKLMVTSLSKSCYHGKITQEVWKIIMDVQAAYVSSLAIGKII